MEKTNDDSDSEFSQISDSDTEPEVKLNVTEVEEEAVEEEKKVEEVKQSNPSGKQSNPSGKPTKTKPTKKVRSQKQIEAFEKARLKRAENLAIKKQAKLAEGYKAYKSAKKKKVVQDIAGNNVEVNKPSGKEVQDIAGNILSVDSSSSDDEQLPPPKTKVTKKTPAKKPTKKPKKKIVYESTSSESDSSSEEEVIVKRKTKRRSQPIAKEDNVDLSYFNVV